MLSFGGTQANQPTTTGFSFGGGQTNQPTTTGFSFGGTQANQPATSGFTFGGTQSNQPTSTGFSFGGGQTNQPTTGFAFSGTQANQPATSGFTFGGTQANQPSTTGFNFVGGQTNQPTTGFSFSGTQANQPTTTGFGFGGGQTNQPATGFSFSGTQANQPTTSGFSFSGNQPNQPQQLTATFFGQNPQQAQQQRFESKIKIDIDEIYKTYFDFNTRLRYIFYNSMVQGAVVVPPPDVPQEQWEYAIKNCPDSKSLIPCFVTRFEGLRTRFEGQQSAIGELKDSFKKIEEAICLFKSKIVETKQKLKSLQDHEVELRKKLIIVQKYSSVLKSRNLSLSPDEQAIQEQIRRTLTFLQAPGQLASRITELNSKAKYSTIKTENQSFELTPEEESNTTIFLAHQQDAIEKITRIIIQDSEEMDKLKEKAVRGIR